jgi:hypothetical protein
MSDFFTRLAERTLGAEPVARPDLVPLVAAVPQVESIPSLALGSVVSESEPAGKEIRSPIRDRRNHSFHAQRAAEPLPPRSAQSDEQEFTAAMRTLAADEPMHPWKSESFEPRETRSTGGDVPQSAVAATKTSPPESARSFARREPVIASPAPQRLDASQSRASDSFASASPTIHVNIGRIEVRAVTAPARPSAPERRPARLSLDQYLRERNEGRR